MLVVSSSNHHQRSGRNLVDGHAIPGSGLLLTTWQTPTLGFRKQERQLRTGSAEGCLRSIAQRTHSGACSYWILECINPFNVDPEKTWAWRNLTSIDRVWFLMWHHTFKMAAMTSFHTDKCCHLVSADAASARHLYSSVWSTVHHSYLFLQCYTLTKRAWLFKKSFRTSSSDTDCVLTFSLCLSVPTLRRFWCLRSTIWYLEVITWLFSYRPVYQGRASIISPRR